MCKYQCYLLTAVDFLAGGLEDLLVLAELPCRFLLGDGLLSSVDSSLLSRARRRSDGFVVGPFLDDDVLSSDIRLEPERDTDLFWDFT